MKGPIILDLVRHHVFGEIFEIVELFGLVTEMQGEPGKGAFLKIMSYITNNRNHK